MKLHALIAAMMVAACGLIHGNALAEASEVRIAQQSGLNYVSMMVMQDRKLLEKHAKAAGLGDIKVQWSQFSGGNVMNDALLSGSLDIASGGLPPLITLWAKTRGNIDVRGVSARSTVAGHLITRNAAVKTIADFTEKDKIALPAVKVSAMAVLLQMAAEASFGKGQHARLDPFTVSLSNPDAAAALLSGGGQVNSHFTWPPYSYYELKNPALREVLDSNNVVGKTTLDVIWTTGKFRQQNPKLYASFIAAFNEATNIVNADKRAAAEFYLKSTKEKSSVDEIMDMMKEIDYTLVPQNTMKFADFMYRTGSIKVQPASWKDLFFPEAHQHPGS